MNPDVRTLLEILDLKSTGVNTFFGQSPNDRRKRIFGGQLVAQALMAAGKSTSHGTIHSLHSYFLKPGNIRIPIRYEVKCIKDGKHFANFQVSAFQDQEEIFILICSFHDEESGIFHQPPMPQVPDPPSLPTLSERIKPWTDQVGDWNFRLRPFDQRYIYPPNFEITDDLRDPNQKLWVRAYDTLPDDPLVHSCAFAFASDSMMVDPILVAHKLSIVNSSLRIASLDHTIWFHRPFKADQWFLYDQESPIANAGRAIVRGHIFNGQGLLVASVAQEVLIRVENSR